jgi:serine/threonine protein kinase/WD40 repeat protein
MAGAAPDADPPGVASEAALLQAAVEQFIELHANGEAPALDVFVQRYPHQMRVRLLAQLREFLAFDGHLGHQEWAPLPTSAPQGREFGEFTIEAELGRGGMGIVYLAMQRSLQRRVALKVMASGLSLSKRHVERFRREAAATAQLRHPAIVPVHSLTEIDGSLAIAMDFVAGRNLADVLDDLRLARGDQVGPIEGTLGLAPGKGYIAECALLCAQLASALAAAHQAGVVHRDLKPRNVMIDDRRQVRLLDFGLAKSAGEGSISMSGEITGTAHYMSPEQTLAKRVEVDHRADIWALGVILYELLTLQRPFDGKNLQQIVYAICFQEPLHPARRNPKVPRDLATICAKALEKDPQRRYASAAELEADLGRFLRWEPIHARPAGVLPRLGKWVRRHRTETLLVAGMAALGLLLLGYSLWQSALHRRAADHHLQSSEQALQRGDFDTAIEAALAALRLHDDPAIVERVARYRALAETAATKQERDIAEARRLCLASAQALRSDRALAIRLALEAVARHPAAESRSAVLDALGSGFQTTSFAPAGGQVFAARLDPTGTHVLTVGQHPEGDAAQLWHADGRPKAALRGHRGQVLDGLFLPQADLVATAGVDQTVRWWRVTDGSQTAQWEHSGVVHLLRCSRDGRVVLSASYGRAGPFVAQAWDRASGTPLGTMSQHQRLIVAAEISPDGRWAASCGDAGFVRLWDAATGAMLAELAGQPERPRALAFSPASDCLAVADREGFVHLYRVPDGSLLGRIAHSRQVQAVAFAPSGQHLLTGGRDQTARLWRLPTPDGQPDAPAELRTFLGHDGDIRHVGFDASGKYAFTTCADGVVRVFDASADATAKGMELLRHEIGAALEDAGFGPDAGHLLVQVGSQRALLWHCGERNGIVALRQPGPVPAASFDGTGSAVLTAGDDEHVRRWNAQDGSLQWLTERLGQPVTALAIAADNGHLLVGLADGRLQLRALHDGSLLRELTPQSTRMLSLRLAASGNAWFRIGSDRRAIVQELASGTILAQVERPTPLVAGDLQPAAQHFATVERGENRARLWRVADGSEATALPQHPAQVRTVRFRPDGKAILSACSEGWLCIADLDGHELLRFTTGSPLQHACWSADGTLIATAAARDQHRVRVWRTSDGKELLHFAGHDQPVDSIEFSPDGQWIATASRDATAKIWPTDPERLARRLLPGPTTTSSTASAPTQGR